MKCFDTEIRAWASQHNARIATDEWEYTYVLHGKFNRKTRASLAQMCQQWGREVEMIAKHQYAIPMILGVCGDDGASLFPVEYEECVPF